MAYWYHGRITEGLTGYRPRVPGPEPLHEVTAKISFCSHSNNYERHKPTTKRLKYATNGFETTTKRCIDHRVDVFSNIGGVGGLLHLCLGACCLNLSMTVDNLELQIAYIYWYYHILQYFKLFICRSFITHI